MHPIDQYAPIGLMLIGLLFLGFLIDAIIQRRRRG